MKAGIEASRRRTSAALLPSSLYRGGAWKLGGFLTRVLPEPHAGRLAREVGGLYRALARGRRRVVIQNLLPVVSGNAARAEQACGRLFQHFAQKLVDLWRFERGGSVDGLFAEVTGWERFDAAQARGTGTLLLTVHLGNWEFGGPLLTERGVRLCVVTRPEPGAEFTEARRASRARRGIETLVIGEDEFGSLPILERLEEGATVAMLVDRPQSSSAVTIELFGHPFDASAAAGILARASGCALLPVYVVRTAAGYVARILPEVMYDRAELGSREARERLTQQIMRAFEPAILQYCDQWYHFVPIWPPPPVGSRP